MESSAENTTITNLFRKNFHQKYFSKFQVLLVLCLDPQKKFWLYHWHYFLLQKKGTRYLWSHNCLVLLREGCSTIYPCYCMLGLLSSYFIILSLFLPFFTLFIYTHGGYIWDSVLYNNKKSKLIKIIVWFDVLGIKKD